MTRAESDESGTWHYGLMARWWSEFNVAQPHELAYYKTAVQKFGEPVLDLGCGTGRFLIPLRADGVDVDGVDVSGDMIAEARIKAENLPSRPALFVQPLHELKLGRRYRTMYMCGVLGIGGRRDHDREALRRTHQYLEPGGALLIIHVLPGDDDDAEVALPEPWPETGDRRRCANGDELETLSRIVAFDPHAQVETREIRIRLWQDGSAAEEESYGLRICLYVTRDIDLMLEQAGFREVTVEGNYTGRPAMQGDDTVIFVARR